MLGKSIGTALRNLICFAEMLVSWQPQLAKLTADFASTGGVEAWRPAHPVLRKGRRGRRRRRHGAQWGEGDVGAEPMDSAEERHRNAEKHGQVDLYGRPAMKKFWGSWACWTLCPFKLVNGHCMRFLGWVGQFGWWGADHPVTRLILVDLAFCLVLLMEDTP